MMSIAKLGASHVEYYLEHVGGRDDLQAATAYYADDGASLWRGRGAADDGLSGPVMREQLERLLTGAAPTTGDAHTDRPLKVPAYDFCFSAPKSVSLLWGTAAPEIAAAVAAAHDTAVDTALTWIEDEVLVVRRGKGGAERLPARGLTSASFRHIASRAADPQLHTHCVTSAVVVGADDRSSALDSAAVYRASKIAGAVYQQALRHQLHTSLGVSWSETRNAMAELANTPDDVLAAFSQRSVAMRQQLDPLGHGSTARARQAAALATREAKDEAPEQELRGQWRSRLVDLGWDAEQLIEVARRRDAPRTAVEIGVDLEGPDGVTEKAAHFGRREALLAWFDHAPASWSPSDVVSEADRWLARQVEIRPMGVDPGGWTTGRYTCEEILDAERRFLEVSARRFTERATARCLPPAVTDAVVRHTLTEEQQKLVEDICLSGRGLTVAVGVAGSGKSHALRAATDALQVSGLRVIATSTAAKAAMDLAEAAGMDHAASLARLLGDLERGRAVATNPDGRRRWAPFALDERTVVVVDEGAMAETRHLTQLAEAAEAVGAKLVLVGDPEQLQAVGAGGGLLDLAHLGGVVDLTTTVRAEEAWERDAQVRWRSGDPSSVDDYLGHDRVTLSSDPDASRQHVLEAWAADVGAGRDALMVAYRRVDVAALNDAARQHRIDSGGLADKVSVEAAECDDKGQPVRTFRLCAGDKVIMTRNTSTALNGQQGTVASTHLDGSVTVRLMGGREQRCVHMDQEHLAGGGLALAYALTGHKSQGVTVDACHVLADGSSTKQWAYSALTRGRQTNTMTFVADPDRDATPAEQLAEAWMRDDLERTAASLLAAQRSPRDGGLDRELALAR